MNKLVIVIHCLIVVLFNAYQLNAAWHIETVDGESGESTSLAIDSADKVHISYIGGDSLKYANNVSGTWVIESVASTVVVCWGGPPFSTSLALDANNKVHIAFCDRYTTNVTGSWVTEVVGVGCFNNSLTLDSLGNAHIIGIYYQDLGLGMVDWSLQYAINATGSWVINEWMVVPYYSSLALDSNDSVYISYFTMPSGLHYTSNASGSWSTELVDGESFSTWWSENSLVIDSADKIHLIYFSEGSLKYATNASGPWVKEFVDDDEEWGSGRQCKLSLDSNDKAHIIYHNPATSELKYATNASGVWIIENVDYLIGGGTCSTGIDIALDSVGRPHISYHYWNRASEEVELKYARQCFEMDADCDDVFDPEDNCPDNYNPEQEDCDADGLGDVCDSCPVIPNGHDLGICRDYNAGASCISDEDCGIPYGDCYLNQEESACSCVSNFDCDRDVDGSDAANFKTHFGRSSYINPCTNESLCKGDYDCDSDVDGTDASRFKRDFGRVVFCSADYSASCSTACLSCVDDVYAYTCNYEE